MILWIILIVASAVALIASWYRYQNPDVRALRKDIRSVKDIDTYDPSHWETSGVGWPD